MRNSFRLRRLLASLSILFVTLALSIAPPLQASEVSQHQLEKAHDRLSSGQLEQALEHLKKAERNDSRDIEVLYLQGQIYINLERWDEARMAFLKVVALDDGYKETQLHLGMCYYHLEYYQQSLDHLAIAQNRHPSNARIAYYQGLIYHKAQDYVSGIPYFQKAMRLDPQLALNSNYYMGFAYYRQEEDPTAIAYFREAIRLSPGSTVAQSAQQFITAIQKKRGTQDWEVDIGIGAQWDDNLRLETDDFVKSYEGRKGTLKEENEDVTRQLNTFGFLTGWLSPLKSDHWTGTARFSVYKSYHPDSIGEEEESETAGLTDNNRFDLLDIEAGLGGDFNHFLGTLPFRLSLFYDFKYSNLDNEAYFGRHNLSFSGKLAESPDWTYTDLTLAYRKIEYSDTDYEFLSGSEIQVGVAQYLYFADKHAYFQLGLDHRIYSADKSFGGSSYDHSTNQILARLYLGFVVSLDLSAQIEMREFDSGSSSKDTITTLGATVSTVLEDSFKIHLGVLNIKYDNDNESLNYTRNILTLSLAVLI